MSPQPEIPTDLSSRSGQQNEFSAEERTLLLKLAHEAIASRLHGHRFSPGSQSAHLSEPRGAFTTVYLEGELRGCVGYALAVSPLYLTVIETARSAAFEDPRFPPITLAELQELELSLSVLSRLCAIVPDEVEVGRHGLLITCGPQRGLLLPQVPVEHGWDRVTFLEQTCRKAGLPINAWQAAANIEAFTAEVFGDHDLG